MTTQTLSECQLASGNNRRIYHGINRVRDVIESASKQRGGFGMLDNDYKCAFDYMIMLWVFKVMLAKGVDKRVVDRLTSINKENITVVVVNNIPGKAFTNTHWSMRKSSYTQTREVNGVK